VVPVLVLLGATGSAYAAADASIDHSDFGNGVLHLLVSVPGTDTIDLQSVKVSIGGVSAPATAVDAATSSDVTRSTVIAIDTSASMAGQKFDAAKAAASTYLSTVPANVKVGIVTFDNTVVVRQQPSLDRTASRSVLSSLSLKVNTALYSGVQTAITTLGTDHGLHQIIILSDGHDNTGAPLQPVIDAIKKSGVKVDAVALEQTTVPAPLAAMASAGGGKVISATAAALTQAFASEADVLVRQIAITATVPKSQSATDASVSVSVTAGTSTHTASAFVAVKAAGGVATPPVVGPPLPAETSSSVLISRPVLYGALGAIALGIIGVAAGLTFGGGGNRQDGIADQLEVYSAKGGSSPSRRAQLRAQQNQSSTLAEQARQAATSVLATNTTMEARITHRLEGAGMALKSAEWLLLHLGIVFGLAILGGLLSAGNPLVIVLCLIIGGAGPWAFLAFKRTQRLKAFDASLADTLQLISGSLTAGLSLAQSMDTIVREGTEPITSEFKRVIVETRLGVELEDALDGVADRMHSKDFRWVVMAIRIQRQVGGNLAELLQTVAATLREREYLRRHVSALSAEGRLSCWILGVLPPGFLMYLSITRPDYVHPLYTTALGILMLVVMVVLLTVGVIWMSKVAKVEI
jgi:tight adherence protein B